MVENPYHSELKEFARWMLEWDGGFQGLSIKTEYPVKAILPNGEEKYYKCDVVGLGSDGLPSVVVECGGVSDAHKVKNLTKAGFKVVVVNYTWLLNRLRETLEWSISSSKQIQKLRDEINKLTGPVEDESKKDEQLRIRTSKEVIHRFQVLVKEIGVATYSDALVYLISIHAKRRAEGSDPFLKPYWLDYDKK